MGHTVCITDNLDGLDGDFLHRKYVRDRCWHHGKIKRYLRRFSSLEARQMEVHVMAKSNGIHDMYRKERQHELQKRKTSEIED